MMQALVFLGEVPISRKTPPQKPSRTASSELTSHATGSDKTSAKDKHKGKRSSFKEGKPRNEMESVQEGEETDGEEDGEEKSGNSGADASREVSPEGMFVAVPPFPADDMMRRSSSAPDDSQHRQPSGLSSGESNDASPSMRSATFDSLERMGVLSLSGEPEAPVLETLQGRAHSLTSESFPVSVQIPASNSSPPLKGEGATQSSGGSAAPQSPKAPAASSGLNNRVDEILPMSPKPARTSSGSAADDPSVVAVSKPSLFERIPGALFRV
jgi:hypothetical protein